jgi:acylphosphatase
MLTEVHIIVRGSVQGVGFRMHAQHHARLMGVNGYVRNLANGDVEIVAQGEGDAVERLVAWAGRGPPSGRVERTTVERREPTAHYSGFDIR